MYTLIIPMKVKVHTLHIPVMGTAFSIDTAVKVAKYGISSVLSLVDDTLIEEMRKFYCGMYKETYEPITKYESDFRARRITAYLNLLDQIVQFEFKKIQSSSFEAGSEITKYFEMLPEDSSLRQQYLAMLKITDPQEKIKQQDLLRSLMRPGDINVNIMTKLDRPNYSPKGEDLGEEFSDALSALRGYALSTLHSGIVFSAGINRRLYSYMEKFEDFYADANGYIKKKIILKVSDYRSSIIQGKFIAKKGLWVSEYRIESGLNCGGHAFASDGFLMGPILEEFKNKRSELINGLHETYSAATKLLNRPVFEQPLATEITAQGGIGNFKEDRFLMEYYNLDGTGWGTPFLLCPEATNVDDDTLQKLSRAGEDDVYLSEVSPLGVPFNNLRQSPSELEKERKIALGRPGSACPKSHLVSNTEFTKVPICTASRQYQKLKIEDLQKQGLPESQYQQKYNDVITKSCICHDLGEAAIIKNAIGNQHVKHFTAVCPGPNIAYFSKIVSLKEMMDHIYGRINLLNSSYRPNMFIKELGLYIDYFIKEVKKVGSNPTPKQVVYLNEFRSNMSDGIKYYHDLFPRMVNETKEYRDRALEELQIYKDKLNNFIAMHPAIFPTQDLKLAVV
jgi:hypothetical protein